MYAIIDLLHISENFSFYTNYFPVMNIQKRSRKDGFNSLITGIYKYNILKIPIFSQIELTIHVSTYIMTHTGEGSPITFWENRFTINQQNINQTEPVVLLTDEILHITKTVKIIVIIRNPTERLVIGKI